MHSANDNKKLTINYALIQMCYWMNFAAITGFTSVYLLHVGFTNTQIGVLIALAGAVCSVLQPVLASYADRPASPSLKKILIISSTGMILIAVLLLLLQKSLILTGFFYTVAVTLLQLIMPLINSLGMESLNQGKQLNYGIARGMGSASYGIAAYILGVIVAAVGEVTVPVAMLLGFGALLLTLLAFPFQKMKKAKQEKTKKNDDGLIYFFRKYRRFCVTLCGCVFIYIGHVLINNFAFQIVESKGGGSSEMGLAIAVAAIVELPTMFLFGWMLKKVRVDIWFRISGIFFVLKSLGTLLAPNMMTYYVIQIFQMFGWALITVSSVYYVNSIMEEQDAIKGQAYMTMTYTLGSVLASLAGGVLIDAAGVNSMLGVSVAAGVIGMLIIMGTAGPSGEKKS